MAWIENGGGEDHSIGIGVVAKNDEDVVIVIYQSLAESGVEAS